MLLTVKQAAWTLRVRETCVYWLLQKKCLKHFRFGRGRGTIRIEDYELEKFVRKNTVPKARQPATPPVPHRVPSFT